MDGKTTGRCLTQDCQSSSIYIKPNGFCVKCAKKRADGPSPSEAYSSKHRGNAADVGGIAMAYRSKEVRAPFHASSSVSGGAAISLDALPPPSPTVQSLVKHMGTVAKKDEEVPARHPPRPRQVVRRGAAKAKADEDERKTKAEKMRKAFIDELEEADLEMQVGSQWCRCSCKSCALVL